MSYISVPTWENNIWTTTDFETQEEFRDFILSIFKEPGQYNFDDTSFEFNAQARLFQKNGFFCDAPFKSRDFISYWDDQKLKNRRGCIYKNNGNTWYLTRDYYMWLNFLPIFDKEEGKFGFAKVRDAQYHMALYEILAELHWVHSAILKKRQIASSYFHAAKLINQIWFEEGVTLKMGAHLRDYVNENGTWAFLNEYENFLNGNTAWYRPMNPGKPMNWQQKIQEKIGGRWKSSGLKGRLMGLSFEQSATRGVGGPTKYFFYEEGGIAPTADTTFEYIRPALKSGHITTGMFIIAGSVGDLDECNPLKGMILNPRGNDIFPVKTNLVDSEGTITETGLFIPEQWSMPPYIDQFGNSLVEKALEAIREQRIIDRKELSAEQYQLRISQGPTNIEEAFAFRKSSRFPLHLITAQKRRIENKEYGYELFDIQRDETGKPVFKETRKLPISEFPVSKNLENKEGAIVVWERPVPDPTFSMYYAGIDPIGVGKTTTSESLCSIYIYKNDVEITKQTPDGPQVYIEHGKIVATWCGRFDDINKTHERLEMMLEIYNAWAVVENNVSLFIQHMIFKRKQKYLVPKNQIIFLKDIGSNNNVYQEYGWKNNGKIFTDHILNYAIEFLKEELDTETKTDGTIVRTTYGIERIPDPMLLLEMTSYQDGVNVDRLVAFSSLIAFVRIQQSNRGYIKRIVEDSTKTPQKSTIFTKLLGNPFRHIGSTKSNNPKRPPRSPYKNLH